jgi:hypothetical protein
MIMKVRVIVTVAHLKILFKYTPAEPEENHE